MGLKTKQSANPIQDPRHLSHSDPRCCILYHTLNCLNISTRSFINITLRYTCAFGPLPRAYCTLSSGGFPFPALPWQAECRQPPAQIHSRPLNTGGLWCCVVSSCGIMRYADLVVLQHTLSCSCCTGMPLVVPFPCIIHISSAFCLISSTACLPYAADRMRPTVCGRISSSVLAYLRCFYIQIPRF